MQTAESFDNYCQILSEKICLTVLPWCDNINWSKLKSEAKIIWFSCFRIKQAYGLFYSVEEGERKWKRRMSL